ncbi:MAG TPA: thioredoxin family protein [Steroidobacteraceae bacterium]|nr:thioredoxin family protein [Steroidobacteraceae bacterium]
MKSPLAALAVLLTLLATMSSAAETPFNRAQFDAARAAGKPVAVVFHADWCPTCRAQAPVLKQLMQSPEFKGVTLFVANFDTEKAFKQSLAVTQQSTIVVFKNGKETARSTGDTQQESLAALLRRGVS